VQISSGAARVIPGRGETGSTGNPNASRCSRASRNANTGNPGGKRLEGWEQDKTVTINKKRVRNKGGLIGKGGGGREGTRTGLVG